MLRQYFSEITLNDDQTSLSEALQELVNAGEQELGSPFIEVAQVIRHDETRFTVIVNVDIAAEGSGLDADE